MSLKTLYYWQVAGTLATLIPLIAGFIVFKTSKNIDRIFFYYLIVGFITDLCGWYCYATENAEANMYVRNAYDLFEAVFFFLFIAYTTSSGPIKKFFSTATVLLVLFWASRFLYNTIPVFKTSTQIVEAFGAAFCILQLLEREADATQRPVFWFWLGIFFYCFSTFFLMGILGSKMVGVWYAHAIINMLAYLIYTIGFWRVRQPV
ncbi:MAG: hypothetical protein KF763_05330 [Cyclobacteriaceae bacterium]|nr:hypothetical protein [Cyclobacteriaceae bacterium]